MSERDITNVGAVIENPWQSLRQLTPARIALGRAGASQPTRPHLRFQLAHAQARDAIHTELNVAQLGAEIQRLGLTTLVVSSGAVDRYTYLRRPDLGRQLSHSSREMIGQHPPHTHDVAFVVADGLSAVAVQRHAVPLLDAVLDRLSRDTWTIAPVAIVERGRVAISDEIGALLGADLAVILIGERPGLSSPDSLGVYLTWEPRIGATDAERNCISNIHAAGLSYDGAATTLVYLMFEARQRRLSGIALKDESDMAALEEPMKD